MDFLELRHVLLTYNGDLRDLLRSPRTGQSPFEFLGGLSRFLSLWCRSLRPCVDSVPDMSFPLQC